MVNRTSHFKFIVWFVSLLATQLSYSQVIDIGNGEKVNCKNASGNLEVARCLRHQIEQTEKALDSLYQTTLNVLDSLSIKSDQFKLELRKDGMKQSTMDEMTDYEKIKNLFIRSHAAFLEHVELETRIVGEEMGNGRGRVAYENARVLELLKQRERAMIEKLQNLR